MDYHKLGLRVGLEIHQQLDTHKLFCNCPSTLAEGKTRSILRKLRPTQSELGEVDRAAIAEAAKSLTFEYQMLDTTCLVEADDEPPHNANPEAIDIAILIACMLRAQIVDEIQWMRKVVIDGSNTTGFQRTCLIATDGALDTSEGTVRISVICLEEDAARKIKRVGNVVTYRLDRLGIPLVEVSTYPDIISPAHARETAEKIGAIFRATGKVKRGIGTIRQDLNISITDGARVELKGVQELRQIPVAVEHEVNRQLNLIAISSELKSRGVSENLLNSEFIELTNIFKNTKAKVFSRTLKANGKVVGVKLNGFKGLIGRPEDKYRLGKELAQYAKVKAGVGGIFHSDELPAFGITATEVSEVQERLGVEKERDAFVLVAAATMEQAELALDAVVARAKMAIVGVPEETRDILDDGSSAYSRPLPGAARMYPETDVKPTLVGAEKLDRIKSNLPETIEEKLQRFVKDYGLNPAHAEQLVRTGYEVKFDDWAKKYCMPHVIAKTLLNIIPELSRSDDAEIDQNKISDEMLEAIFSSVKTGKFTKEGIGLVLKHMVKHNVDVDDAIASLQLDKLQRGDIEKVIDALLVEPEVQALISQKGKGALGALMGITMRKLRGKADGKVVNEILSLKLTQYLQKS